jgi:hypothetical protein
LYRRMVMAGMKGDDLPGVLTLVADFLGSGRGWRGLGERDASCVRAVSGSCGVLQRVCAI